MAALWGLSFWYIPTHDPDLGWHLFGGSWTLSHGDVPRQDLINSFGGFWIDYHWLGQIFIFKGYEEIGLTGLRWAFGLFMMIFSLAFARLIEASAGSRVPYLLQAGVLILLGECIKTVSSIRPHMFVLFLLTLVLNILIKPRANRLEIPILFLVTILAANIHVYWIFIPFLWLTYRVIPRYLKGDTSSPLIVWLTFFGLIFAGVVSPYGIFTTDANPGAVLANYFIIFDYLDLSPELKASITEMRTAFSKLELLSVSLVIIVLLIVLNFSRGLIVREFGPVSAALLGAVQASRMIKFASIFGIFSAPIASKLILRLFVRKIRFPLRSIYRIQPLILSVFTIFWAQKAYFESPALNDTTHYMDYFIPSKACAAIEGLNLNRSHGRDHIRVLTHFDFGGWCRWIAYERNPAFDIRVTTDGRTQLVPPDHFIKYFDLYAMRNNWAMTLHEADADVILVHKKQSLAQFLIKQPSHWMLAYEDPAFALFLPLKD
jgi:hypothetical protein